MGRRKPRESFVIKYIRHTPRRVRKVTDRLVKNSGKYRKTYQARVDEGRIELRKRLRNLFK